MKLETPLEEYGLSDKEISVFLELLPLGSVTLQEVAKKVRYPRTTVYNTLNYLYQKGLVAKVVKEKVTYFSAADPERLKANLEEKQQLIESILPDLINLKKHIKNPSSVEIYEGFKGVYTVIADVFSKKQQTYYFGGYADALEMLKHLPEHARMMRLKNNIPAKIVIAPLENEMFHLKKYKRLTEMRFLDAMKEFPVMILIYGDKVAIHTVKGDLVGIIINNKECADAMKLIFDMFWKMGKPSKI